MTYSDQKARETAVLSCQVPQPFLCLSPEPHNSEAGPAGSFPLLRWSNSLCVSRFSAASLSLLPCKPPPYTHTHTKPSHQPARLSHDATHSLAYSVLGAGLGWSSKGISSVRGEPWKLMLSSSSNVLQGPVLSDSFCLSLGQSPRPEDTCGLGFKAQ